MQYLCVHMQGEDVVQDAIRQQQVEAGVPKLIATAMFSYQGNSKEVRWDTVFQSQQG